MIRRRVLAAICLMLLSMSVKAQVPQTSEPIDDPISSMLDSLVTLNNVIRFNYTLAGNPAPEERLTPFVVPSFSEDVYRDRISKIPTPIPLTYNHHVKNYIELYAEKKRALTTRVLGLANLYFPLFEEALDKENLPMEMKYLAIVESALNPIAVSRVGATGIWQFMLNTGKLYNLKVGSYIDERRDPAKATRAACQYFKDMYAIYNDWLLVIAAYNCGAGNVNKAIARSGGKTTFWEIMPYLPSETRGYVPAFIAVCYVMHHAADHNLFPVAPAFSYFEVDTVNVSRSLSFQHLASSLDLPLDVIMFLNPMYKRKMIPESSEPMVLRLPVNKIAAFISSEQKLYSEYEQQVAKTVPAVKSDESLGEGEIVYKKMKKTHVVRSGDNLSEIASRYHCTVSEIRKLNNLRSSRIHTGQKLKVYAMVAVREGVKKKTADSTATASASQLSGDSSGTSANTAIVTEKKNTSETIAAGAPQASGKSRYIYHQVQRGDTLWSIARRYDGVTVQQIKQYNNITDIKSIKVGQKLKVKIAG